MHDELETEGFLLSESEPDDEDTSDEPEVDDAELEDDEEEAIGVPGLDGEEEEE
jgi:hypothetical protein